MESQSLIGGLSSEKDEFKLGKRWKKEGHEALRQVLVLSWKNVLLLRRNWTSTLLRLLFPAFWLLVLYILVSGVEKGLIDSPITDSSSSSNQTGNYIPLCDTPGCITLAYSPNNNTIVEGIINTLCSLNNPPLSFSKDVMGFESRAHLANYTMKNRIYVPISFGVAFDSHKGYIEQMEDSGTVNMEIFLNQTFVFKNFLQTNSLLPDYHLQFKTMLDAAAISYFTGSQVYLDPTPGEWPSIPGNDDNQSNNEVADTIIALLSCVFFFISFFLYFPVTLSEIGRERRLKLREGMEVMGLKAGSYWISYLMINVVYTGLASLIFSSLGKAFAFDFFRMTNFFVLFFGFWFFGLSLVSFSFFFSTFSTTPKSSNIWSFIIFFIFCGITLIYGIPTDNGGLMHQALYVSYRNTKSTGQTISCVICQLIPVFNFAEFVYQINQFTIQNPNQTLAGYDFGDLKKTLNETQFSGTNDFSPPGRAVFGLMIMNIILYYTAAWYFDKTFANDHGAKQGWDFIFKPEFWGFSSRVSKTDYTTYKADLLHSILPDMDPDIIREYQTTINLQEDEEWAKKARNGGTGEDSRRIVLRSLKTSKTYKGKKGGTAEDIRALDALCVSGEKNSVLCFLGHNGAGKTTAINCLTGLEAATSGDALIWGYSIKNDMEKVRRMMGVCPQHDILWPELTAREHLRIYCTIKRVPESEIEAAISKALADVKLTSVGHHPTSTYSGGMKRRLSVAISLLGNPKIVFLDEPTSGMDPGNRRNVWDLIERAKKDRIVVLTTHSMEEADVLGDKICIFALGRLRAVGESLHLKNRFGRGYHITVLSSAEKAEEVKEEVKRLLPNAFMDVESVPGNLSFSLPHATVKQITDFFSWVERAKKAGVEDWGISHTTLEEVFLRITHGDGGGIAVDNRDGGGAIYQGGPMDNNVKQLNIVLEGTGEPVGFVEVTNETTLEHVRQQLAFLDGIPAAFSFLSQGVVVSRRQEPQRLAHLCLPVLTVRADEQQQQQQHYQQAPSPAASAAASAPVSIPALEQRISELQRVIQQQDTTIRSLQERVKQECDAREYLEQQNQQLRAELLRLQQQLQQ